MVKIALLVINKDNNMTEFAWSFGRCCNSIKQRRDQVLKGAA
jgi:hypothetical protein